MGLPGLSRESMPQQHARTPYDHQDLTKVPPQRRSDFMQIFVSQCGWARVSKEGSQQVRKLAAVDANSFCL